MYKLNLFFLAFLFISIAGHGQAGIGATPSTVAGIGPGKFEVTGVGDFTIKVKGDSYTGFGIQSFRESSSDHTMINLFAARGTMTNPSTILSGDNVSTISSRAYTGSGYTPITSIQSYYTGTNQGTIIFSTNGGSNATTERMRINQDGNVGIGTSSPGAIFHIENGNSFGSSPSSTTTPSIYVFNNNNSSSTAHATAAIRTAGTGSGKPYLSLDVNGAFGYSMGINNPTDQLVLNASWDFNTTASNNAIIINRTGQSRVIIPDYNGGYNNDWPSGWGGSLATYDISCSGIYYSNLTQRSDSRLKNNINDISNTILSKYLQLRPVTYYWNQGESSDKNLQYGLIAQEVESIFPEMVQSATDEMQTKSINYQALHAISLKVIQEQQKQIEELKSKQTLLEQRLLKLEEKLK